MSRSDVEAHADVDAVAGDAAALPAPSAELPGTPGASGAPDAVRPDAGSGRHLLGLFANELHTVFRRPRTWVLLAVLALAPIGLGSAVRASAPKAGRGPAFLDQVTGNGLFLVFASLVVMLPLFLPLTVGVISGESVAGESSMGTLRYLLVAPAGRTRLLLAKLTAVVAFCIAATFTVVLSALATGAVLFPVGRVTLLSGDTIPFPSALLRALVVALLVVVSLLGLAALGLFISTLTSTPIAAMAATVGIAVVAQILDAVPQLDPIHPWLFSHYWMSFGDMLRNPVYTHDILRNLLEQALYLVVFGTAAWARLSNKDVTS